MARLHTGRHKVLSTYRSLPRRHPPRGQPDRRPAPLGQRQRLDRHGALLRPVPLPHARSTPTTEAEECERALEHLEQVVALEGPRTIAAIMLEAIPGTAGIMVPPPGYLAGVRELCDRHGIVLIADEVMSGFGRAGQVVRRRALRRRPRPDHLRQGRELRLRAARRRGHQRRDPATFAHRAYPGGLTYSGHPLACAAAVATINADGGRGHRRARRPRSARTSSAPACASSRSKHASVGEVRGTGAFWAIELVTDRETREPLAPYGGVEPGDGRGRRRPARRAGCCPSPTSTASTSCRPATPWWRMPGPGSPSWTKCWTSRTASPPETLPHLSRQ